MVHHKKTLVLGASANPSRYSYLAIKSLRFKGHPVEAIGLKNAEVEGVEIRTGKPLLEDIDTITLYLSAERQREYYDYILSLKPRRIIFNPGAENDELYDLAQANHIYPQEACTLVMLSTGQY
ncbi:CoA-binding protein [Flavihumibacter stibioxidans]|uniref:CoA-binding protein n=1 Tax=Flavihumibacter stibioxidans TaxID=1834163 RepID=A0ABR7M6V8_9BACT|nr:CoA-binding protein [Flavihumibacter stibioxidans]MBC6490773.1 CoA-binding protein [Flavihumibacter stibioxidans]